MIVKREHKEVANEVMTILDRIPILRDGECVYKQQLVITVKELNCILNHDFRSPEDYRYLEDYINEHISDFQLFVMDEDHLKVVNDPNDEDEE